MSNIQRASTDLRGSRLPYLPALDGMRGLAVAAVLAYHAGLPWARGGFLGVDVFFVLSGYLITSLLLSEWRATGSISLAGFWARRARRLLPALFLLLAGVAWYAVVFAEPEELAALRGDALATLGYVANWRPVFLGDSYFQQFTVPSPLHHTWSLAIEEQWYLAWPIMVLAALRVHRGSPGMLFAAGLVLAAGSALLMGWLHDPQGDPSRVYYGTDTRAQSLLVGAVLASWLAWRGPPALNAKGELLLQLGALVCAGYIGWMWVDASYDGSFLYRGGFLLLALAAAVVIAATVCAEARPLARVLSVWPLRALGVISYGVYLWHWPVYLVLTPERMGWDGYQLFAARILLTVLIATASYRLVETPVRRGALREWRLWPVLAPAAAAVLVIGLLLVTRSGGEHAFTASTSSVPASPGVSAGLSSGSPPVRVLVVGDSVAFTMAQGLSRADAWNLSVWNQGTLGCGVLRADAFVVDGERTTQGEACNDWPARWRSYVDVFQPDVAVVLGGAWDLYDREVDGRLLRFGTPEADAFVLDELEEAVAVLSSRGATVILLTTPYFKPRELALAGGGPRFDLGRIERFNSLYTSVAQRHPAVVSVFDVNDRLSSAVADGRGMGDRDISPDGVHFTPEGADLVAQELAPAIWRAAVRNGSLAFVPAPAGDRTGAATAPPRWLELLAQVPDTDETRSWTVMNDYARYREAFGVALPAANADEDALFDYYRRLLFDEEGKASGLAPAGMMGLTEFPPRLAGMRTRLGFSIADVDQDIRTGGYPMEAIRGRLVEGRIDAASRAGEAAPIDQGLTLAAGAYLYWSMTSADLDAMADAASGRRGSLADVPEFQLLAGALDRIGTYTALLSMDNGWAVVEEMAKIVAGPDAGPEAVGRIRERLQREPKLLPYDAFATGAGVDARGSYTAVVLLNGDEETARANRQRLQDRIDEATSWVGGQAFREFIDGVEIRSEGRLVLAKLYTDAHGLWFALQAFKDTLLLLQE